MSKIGRMLALTLVALMALSIVGHAAEPIELRVAWWGSQNRHDRTLEAIKLFEEMYPHITVLPEQRLGGLLASVDHPGGG